MLDYPLKKHSAEGGIRTHTGDAHTALNRARLPVSPLRQNLVALK